MFELKKKKKNIVCFAVDNLFKSHKENIPFFFEDVFFPLFCEWLNDSAHEANRD